MEKRQETVEERKDRPEAASGPAAISDVFDGADSVFEMEEIQRLYKELLGKTSEYLKSEFEGKISFLFQFFV